MKKLVIMVVSISLILLYATSSRDKNTVTIYASTEQFRNDALQERLNEKFPDKNIRVMYLPTAKAAAKIYLEKDRTDADIVLALETSYLEKISDELEDVRHLSTIPYLEEFDESIYGSKYVIWERFGGAIVVNNKELKKRNLPQPRTYEDLLNPIYKNLIAMPDPKSSGTGFFYFKNRVNTMGEAAALEYFDALTSNIKQYTESGSGPIKLMNQGEVAIALAMTFQAVNEINNGHDYEIIYPQEGSPYSLSGTGLIKGRAADKDIVEIFKYIINDFIIYDKEMYSPEMIYKGQINNIPNYPQDIDYADMTGIESIVEKERLLDLWKH